jgi:hypothetical protein
MAERASRITIMDGDVVSFARAFDKRPGAFGESADARGPYDVSASRNMVCVHKADLSSDETVEEFIAAVREAQQEARRLSRGWGGNYKRAALPQSEGRSDKA